MSIKVIRLNILPEEAKALIKRLKQLEECGHPGGVTCPKCDPEGWSSLLTLEAEIDWEALEIQ